MSVMGAFLHSPVTVNAGVWVGSCRLQDSEQDRLDGGERSGEGLLVVGGPSCPPLPGMGHLPHILTVALGLVSLLLPGELLELASADLWGEAPSLTQTIMDMCFSTATFKAEVWGFMWSILPLIGKPKGPSVDLGMWR